MTSTCSQSAYATDAAASARRAKSADRMLGEISIVTALSLPPADGRAGLEFRHVTHPSGTRHSVELVDHSGRRLSFSVGRHPFDLTPEASR